MKMNFPKIILLLPVFLASCAPAAASRQGFSGYIDSPYIVPDGTAIYFLHSVASTYDMLTGNPNAKPVAEYFPNHQGQGGAYWYNTDLYRSQKNPNGTWGQPQNLGPQINTENLECCMWTDSAETVLLFVRSAGTGDTAVTIPYIARRDSRDEPWGTPQELPGEFGLAANEFTDFHLTPAGNLYFWSPWNGNGTLFYAASTGTGEWGTAENLTMFESQVDESQPWVNADETILFFNRRAPDGSTELWMAARPTKESAWGAAEKVVLTGFEEPAGGLVWGEPSFDSSGAMYFVRFNVSLPGWDAELMKAERNADGSYGPPQPLVFDLETP